METRTIAIKSPLSKHVDKPESFQHMEAFTTSPNQKIYKPQEIYLSDACKVDPERIKTGWHFQVDH